MNNVVIGMIGAGLSGAILGVMIQVVRLRNIILLHWTYMQSLDESLETLKQAIEAVDEKSDRRFETLWKEADDGTAL